MAGIYNGHLLEFPQIRVDCFLPSTSTLLPTSSSSFSSTSTSTYPAPNAQLFLLTHVHSDHLYGLSDDFTGKIICSPDTKRMLLRLEPEIQRGHLQNGLKEQKTLRLKGLKRKVLDKGTKDERIIDHIEAVPYNHPMIFEIGYENGKPLKVTITLLDANHCPGSTMFLISSADKAVLHTGDIRADTQFIHSLKRIPAVQQFLAPPPASSLRRKRKSGQRVLDRIYLDTSAVMGTGDMPDREPVLQDMVEQMSLYPPDTIFFLNVWCFGWESVVQAVARHFNELVYVDRYKRSIYAAVETDPFLLSCTTTIPESSRFHACERTSRCHVCRQWEKGKSKPVYNLDKLIVTVNMVEVKQAAWEMQHRGFVDELGRAAVGEGQWPRNIRVPFARHSPLPELQNLVKLFQPMGVSPNALTPTFQGLDYYALPEFLKDCLADDDAYEGMIRERDTYLIKTFGEDFVKSLSVMTTTPDGSYSAGIPNANQMTEEVSPIGPVIKMEMSSSRSLISLDQLERIGMTMTSLTQGQGRDIVPDDYDTDDEDTHQRKRRRRRVEPTEFRSDLPVIKRRSPLVDGQKVECTDSPNTSTILHQTMVDIDIKPDTDNSLNSTRNLSRVPSRFSLGSDGKERIRKLMARDRSALALVPSGSMEIKDEVE